MPLNPRQFIGQMKQRRAAVKSLNSAAGTAGHHDGFGFSQNRQGDPFGNNNGPFSAPNAQQRLESATSHAKSVGVSSRKINKTVNKAREIGNSVGSQDRAFGTGKPNPFTSNQRYGK